MSSVTGRLTYDPTADSSSHKIGAYILAGDDGTQIGHVSDALKVDIGSVSDLDIRDLVYTQDSVTAHQGGTWTIDSITNDVSIDDGGNSITVDANQLDIDDLNATDDAVAAWLNDGSGNAIGSTGGALDVNVASGDLSVDLSHTEDSVRLGDGTNFLTSTNVNSDWALDVHISDTEIAVTQGSDTPWAVEATDLDIRDLDESQDSVRGYVYDKDGNGITSTLNGSDQSLDVNVTNSIDLDDDLANTAILASATAVSTTAVNVVSSALADRKHLALANRGNKELFFGQSSVTVNNGFPLEPGMKQVWRIGPSVAPQIIGETGASSEDLRVLELS